MPKSKHRKQPFRTAVQRAARVEAIKKAQDKAREIYDRALPKHQEYPPLVLDLHTKQAEHQRTPQPKDAPSKMASFYPRTEMKPGRRIRMSDRTYVVGNRGNLIRVYEADVEKKAA